MNDKEIAKEILFKLLDCKLFEVHASGKVVTVEKICEAYTEILKAVNGE